MEQTIRRALLVIDVQNEYFKGLLPVTYPPGSFQNILKAMDTADKLRITTILVQHTGDRGAFIKGTEGWRIHPEIIQRRHHHLIEKTLPGSFTHTDLDQRLRLGQIDTLTITGYMTQMCCDTTARQAAHLGYGVEFLSDATGTLAISNEVGQVTAEELHRAILVTQATRFSKVMTTNEWIKLIQP